MDEKFDGVMRDGSGNVAGGPVPYPDESIVRDEKGVSIGIRGESNGPGPAGEQTPVHRPPPANEEERKIESIRGLLLECINIAYREYKVRGLRHFRNRIEDARTLDEILVARDMLLTIGRFHDTSCVECTNVEPR